MKIIKFIIPSLLLFTPIGVFAEGCEIYKTDPVACQEAAASGCYWSSENDSVLGVISVCNQCVSGDHSTGTKCEPCPTGSYCVNGVETPCPVGTYNANPGSSSNTACTPCESGTYNDQTGQSSCKGCTNLPTGSSYFGEDNTPKYLTGENYSGQTLDSCPWEFECPKLETYAECSDGGCSCKSCPDQYTISSNRSFPSKITFIDSGYQSTGSRCASDFKPIKVVVNTESYGKYIAGIETFLMAANYSDGEWRISYYETPLASFQRKNNFYGLYPKGDIDYSVGDLVSEKAGKEGERLFSLGVGCGASTCPDCNDPQNAGIRDCDSCHIGWCRIYMIDNLNYGDYIEVDSNGDKIIRVKLSSLSPKGPVLEVPASVLTIDYKDDNNEPNKKHLLQLYGTGSEKVSLYASFNDFKTAKGGNVASFYYGVAPDRMNKTKICDGLSMPWTPLRYDIDLKELVPKKYCPSESDKNYYNFSYDELEPTPWGGMEKGLPPLSMDESGCICGGSENKRGYVIFAFSGRGPCPVGCYCDTDGPHQCPGGFTTTASKSTKITDCVLRYDTEFIESYNGEKNCVYGCNSGFNHIFDDYKLKIQN